MRVLNLLLALLSFALVITLWGSGASWYMDMGLVGLGGITIGLQATALGNFFALLVSFSWVMVSVATFATKQNLSFLPWLPLLSASLFLIVYTVDYLLFFVGWEVMSITTYFILATTLTPKALIKYILFAMASALSLLMAIVVLYSGAESLLYKDAHQGFIVLSEGARVLLMLLMLFALFIKLGSIGFHYWLVDSYSESSDLFTAYLSAVLSKMGIYALIIFLVQVVDIGSLESYYLGYGLAIMGVMTSIIATFKAIREDEIKRLLAYSSIAQLGYIVTVLAIPDGVGGAVYHALIHTLVKLLLFINIAGIIAITGRSKLSQLGGLIYRMPHSFVLLLIGIIVIAGMPPLGGFASKYLIYTSLIDAKFLLILSGMMFASVSAFLYVYKLIYGIYLGHPTHQSLESVKEVSYWYLIPQYIIALLLITIGTLPALVVPSLNAILAELQLTPIAFESVTTLETAVGSFDGFVVMGAFGMIFVLVLLFVWRLNSRAKEVENRFDIAYCGEEPTTATPLHYGYSMGQELGRVGFIGTIWRKTTAHFYERVATILTASSGILRKIYTGNLAVNYHWIIAFATLLLWWGLS